MVIFVLHPLSNQIPAPMKRSYASILAILFAGGTVLAQSKALNGPHIPIQNRVAPSLDRGIPEAPAERGGGGGALWSDDLSDPSTWVTGNFPNTPPVPWQIGVGLQCTGDYPIATIQSTTYDNGCAMIDSDAFNNNSGIAESSHMTTAAPIDLSGYPYVVLEFESFYRKWTNEECYVVISTNNTDWPALTPQTDISGMPNVFHVWPGMEVQAPVNNPTKVRINISQAAGGQSQVWVRFHWTGVWGYAWFVDDVAIVEQPENDVVMNSALVSQVATGEQYGRIPANQLGTTLQVGGEYMNFGYAQQTGVTVNMQLLDPQSNVVASANVNAGTMASGQTALMDQSVNIPTLAPGLYSAVFTVTSDQEQSGVNFANNVYIRTMEVNPLRFSLDGLGNHPPGYESVGSLGTNSFTDGSDGFMMFAYYDVRTPMYVTGLEVAITTTSVPGALLYGTLHHEDNILNDQVTSPIDETVGYDLTAGDVTNGILTLAFDFPVLLQPGPYYAGVEMYSNGNVSDVRILNDLTATQPALSSLIYIPNDQVYTNGNAAAIRLVTDPTISVAELDATLGVSLFPNPTNGILNFRSDGTENHLVEVLDPTGRLVRTERIAGSGIIDLAGHASGVYLVRVSTLSATATQRITLH